MNKELSVGMYVRTINNKAVGNGVIGRIKYINERDFNGKQKKYYSVWTNNKNWFEIGSASEVKSSNNIIDLIEAGDYVEYKQSNMYWNIPTRVSGRYNRQQQLTELMVDDTPLKNVEITSIVTKEQFASMEYVVDNND